MAKIGLRDIVSSGDRAAVTGLCRGPGQDQDLGSMEEIFAGAHGEQRAMPDPWAAHDAGNGALAGFAMISDNVPPADGRRAHRPAPPVETAHRPPFQVRGYGTATLDAVVGYLPTRPGADVLYTSCADGPGSPRGFCLRHGFADTGRVKWGENVLADADRRISIPTSPIGIRAARRTEQPNMNHTPTTSSQSQLTTGRMDAVGVALVVVRPG
jgi:hypothetical protein